MAKPPINSRPPAPELPNLVQGDDLEFSNDYSATLWLRAPFPPKTEVATTIALGLLLLLFAAIVYAPAWSEAFVWDDRLLVLEDPSIRGFQHWQTWFSAEHAVWLSERLAAGTRFVAYEPLAVASYALDWATGYRNGVMFHFSSVAWHAVASALAFFTLRRWTGSTWAAWVGALWFALHPGKADSVAWIAGRGESLSAIGMFVALAGFSWRSKGWRAGYLMEGVGLGLALLSSVTGLILPGLIVVEAWVLRDRPRFTWRRLRYWLWLSSPYVFAVLVYLLARAVWLPFTPLDAPAESLSQRIAHALDALGTQALPQRGADPARIRRG